MPFSKQLRILVVEDNPDHAEMILRHIRRLRTEQLRAERSERLSEGIEALSRSDWDAVLLDLQLPDSHGFETLERMISHAAQVPVIVLTSLGDEVLASRALQQGAQDYLVKDQITTDLLSRTVRYSIERKRIEDRLKMSVAALAERAAELEDLNGRLQEQNRDLDNFNHMISHDLREPIRHLQLFSQRLRANAGTLPEKAGQDLQHVEAAAERMASSIAGLQTLSLAGRGDITRSRVALDDCVHAALADLDEVMTQREATIRWDALPMVEGDAALLTLLFRNLVSNAIKYCNTKPLVQITAEQKHGGQWVFGVRDNGIGLAPRYSESIFVPFQRLHGRGEYGGGSGLGLAICQKIVTRHGGRIWVVTQPGEGAQFLFTLSPERAAAAPGATLEAARPV